MLTGSSIVLPALLALAAPPPAVVGGIPIRVEFDAPAGCSSADTFYGGLLARMSSARRAMPGEDAIHMGVRLTRVGSRVRGELRLMTGARGEGDTRRVEGETCDAVVEVLSLTAALALVARPIATPPPSPPPPPRQSPPPRSSSSSSSSQSSPSSSQSSSSTNGKPPAPEAEKPSDTEEKPPVRQEEPEPPPVAVEPASPPRAPARGARFELGLHAVAADVITDAVSFGGALGARLEKNADGAGASAGLAFLYTSNDLLQNPDAIDIKWMALAATACPSWSLGHAATLQPCARAIGGWLSASGRGLTNPRSVGRTWWSAGALVRADLHLGAGFSLELEAGASIPLVGRSFVTTTPERTVGHTPTVSPMVTLGLSRSL